MAKAATAKKAAKKPAANKPAAKKAVAARKVLIPARHGKATFLKKGQSIKVINTHGTQVVDCWAFNANDLREFMSMEHCRVMWDRYRPKAGDFLYTNKRRKILKFTVDTSPGVHDTMMAACDRYRYELLGCKTYHRNCNDNMWEAMIQAGYHPSETPSPFNLWQNTPVDEGGAINQYPTVSKRGDYLVFRAEMDLVIVFSACPQDIMPINNKDPKAAHFQVV
jgi:uncharacterized protein YcgI (DUF1989 family)